MIRFYFLLLALSHSLALPYTEKRNETYRELELLERLLEVEGLEDQLESRATGDSTKLDLVGKTAHQTSVQAGGVASRAVDGRRDSNFAHLSCSHTARATNPNWMVDIEEEHCISKVTLYNRQDCCSERLQNAQIRVGLTNVIVKNTKCGSPVTSDEANEPGGVIVRECDQPILARYISVGIHSTSRQLVLCEVEAEEVPMERCVSANNEIDACAREPCRNGAECANGGNGVTFICNCPGGFTGFLCETWIKVETEFVGLIDYHGAWQISSPTGDTYSSASRVRDGRTQDLVLLDADGNLKPDGSCTTTTLVHKPFLGMQFDVEPHCISRISILTPLDGQSGRSTDFKVTVFQKSEDRDAPSPTCFTLMSTEDAALPGANIEYHCAPAVKGNSVRIRIESPEPTLLQICEVRVWEIPSELCERDSNGETELILTGHGAFQSSRMPELEGEIAAEKAIDGQFDNAKMYGDNVGNLNGGSCTATRPGIQRKPMWGTHLRDDHCITRVTVLNRADSMSELLEGAIVSVGLIIETGYLTVCGSPVTAEQAADTSGPIEFECSQPVLARFITVSIPTVDAILQLCEVRAWEVPLEQCIPGREGQLELSVINGDATQINSGAERYTAAQLASHAVDGLYADTNERHDIVSCTLTGQDANPWWRLDLGDEHCIGTVGILLGWGENREVMEGAVLRAGDGKGNQCGSPISKWHALTGNTIYFSCIPLAKAENILITNSGSDAMLSFCEVRVFELPMDQCNEGGSPLQTELVVVGARTSDGSSILNRDTTWDKAVDGRYDDAVMEIKTNIAGGSCFSSNVEENPKWLVLLDGEHCISRVGILNRADGREHLTGATVSGLAEPVEPIVWVTCGSPVTAEQAAVPGATVFIDCDPPVTMQYLMVQIISPEAILQMCEVRVWELPMDQCPRDECASDPCLNGAECVDGDNEFTCTCADGFTGTICETDIDECEPNPCLNDGVCVDEVNGFHCECAPKFEGTTCLTRLCTLPCGEHGRCLLMTACNMNGPCSYSENCHCQRGYKGLNCEIDINECESSPCQNGECHNEVNGFRCECSLGYEGTLCGTDINGCEDNPCQNGNCHDEVDGFSCECSPGYEGALCDSNIDECISSPCQNGVCHDDVNRFSCECSPGYEGTLCETDINGCEDNPCQNGNCHDEVDGFSCECSLGYEGGLCDSNIIECHSDPCQNQGLCVDQVDGFICECTQGYEGTLCETNTDECASNPCKNGAECMDGVDEVSCTCAAGYSGVLCEIDINECDSSPCHNGVCVEAVDRFSCECSPGFHGDTCEINIDECDSSPCQNGAKCVDGDNEVTCECAAGFSGFVCEITSPQPVKLTPACDSNPCQNGVCHDQVDSFSCECFSSYEGTLCETAAKKSTGCTINPCKNGICIIRGDDGFKCMCSPGFVGTACETNIDECASNPCQNGGQCEDGIYKMSCVCAEGFTGSLCEIAQTQGSPDNVPEVPLTYPRPDSGLGAETNCLHVNLVNEYCIRKVVVHKRGYCTGYLLAGSVVRAGTNPTWLNNGVCGSVLTARQAEVRRSTVDFVCNPPLTAQFVTVDIPSLRLNPLQLCEVTVEQSTPGPC